jgi:hypothetical protein
MKDSKSAAVPKTRIGWFQPLLWGLLLAFWSGYNIHHGVRSFGGWVWNGLLMLIAALNFLLSGAAVFGKEWVNLENAAKRLAANQKKLFHTTQVYRPATEDDYRKLDKTFYAKKSKELESLRFRKMREVVNVTASNAWPKNHAVIRGFLDPSGTVYASVYDVQLFGVFRLLQFIGVIPRNMKTAESESELSDGTFVGTSNTKETNKTLDIPFVVRTQFSAVTATEVIVSTHQKTLASVLAAKPGVTATVFRSNADVEALQHRMNLMKSAYRLSPEFDSRAEWEKIAGRELNTADEETLAHFNEAVRPGEDSQ